MKASKIRALFLAMAALGVLLFGCNNTEKVLPRKSGIWLAVSYVVKVYQNNTLDTTLVNDAPELGYQFFNDGTGTSFVGSSSTEIDWEVVAGGDELNICYDWPDTLQCVDWQILESSKIRQKWRYTYAENGNGSWEEGELTLEPPRD